MRESEPDSRVRQSGRPCVAADAAIGRQCRDAEAITEEIGKLEGRSTISTISD